MMSPPDQPSPRAPAGARHFGPQSHWSSEILNGPGLGRTRDLKIPALSENLLRRSHARVLVLQVLFPLHSLPSLPGPPSVKMADVKKGKTPKEFFGVYHAFVASMLPACGFDMEN